MIRFTHYNHPERLAPVIGPCPRGHCASAMVTTCVHDSDDLNIARIPLSCDNERCLVAAVELVRTGQGI